MKYNECVIDVFDTGDGTRWGFEVRLNGKLIGESNDTRPTRNKARTDAKNFSEWYIK